MNERGQTMPFWALAVAAVLGMTFFAANYVNQIGWSIRAQNAADSAASAGLAVQANLYNEVTTLLYAAALDEMRIRYLNQAILNVIWGQGGCSGATCTANYTSLVAEYNNAVNSYSKDIFLLGQADQLSQGGQKQDARKAITAFGQNCKQAGGGFDCSFDYTSLDVSGSGSKGNGKGNGNGNGNQFTPIQADVIACRNVSYAAPAIMNLNAGSQFQAVGRAAAVVTSGTPETFQPGVQINPSTDQVYQPPEHHETGVQGSAYVVDFSTLTYRLSWYGSAAIPSYSGDAAGQYACAN